MHAGEFDPEHYYAERFLPLVELALANDVPIEDAYALAHEVLLGSLLQWRRITNLTAWLEQSLKSAIAIRNAGGAAGA